MPSYATKLKPVATSTSSYASKLKPVSKPTQREQAKPSPLGAIAKNASTSVVPNLAVKAVATGLSRLPQAPKQIADAFKSGVSQVKEGFSEAKSGKFPISPALKMGAGLVNTVSAPLAPLVAPIGEAIEKTADKISESKAVQDFAMTEAGDFVAKRAEDTANASTIAGALGGVRSPIPKTVATAVKSTPTAIKESVGLQNKTTRTIARRKNELSRVVDSNASLRRVVANHSAKKIDSVDILSQTDLLKNAVDNTGTIRTQNAISELNDFIAPYEKVVTQTLEREGVRLPLKTVENSLRATIDKSGLEGAALDAAHTKITAEIAGLSRRANAEGFITLGKIHDAKVNKYATLDYMNPSSKMADKAIARTFKELVEKNTKSADVNALNKELGQHFSVLDLLEKLDGKKVEGGRLGKYFGTTIGAIVGSHFGPLGAIAGAEFGARLRGAQLASNKVGAQGGTPLGVSESMKNATAQSKMPPLMLPPGKRGTPGNPAVQSTVRSGGVIRLGDGFKMEKQTPLRQSSSNSLGNLQKSQTDTKNKTTAPTIPSNSNTKGLNRKK